MVKKPNNCTHRIKPTTEVFCYSIYKFHFWVQAFQWTFTCMLHVPVLLLEGNLESQLLLPFIRARFNFLTFAFRALGRNHIASTFARALSMIYFNWTVRFPKSVPVLSRTFGGGWRVRCELAQTPSHGGRSAGDQGTGPSLLQRPGWVQKCTPPRF